jgi:Family of unknown function (DUF6311)
MTASGLQPSGRRTHVLLGALVGLVFMFGTFDVHFFAGTGPRWEHPTPDMVAYLASTFYYWNDAWRVPLFELPAMGYPEGGSVVYNDAIPIGALASKIVASLTGLRIAHFGPWVVLCAALQGAFVARLAYLLGNRSLPATTALVAIVMSLPIALIRPEHFALQSHFLLTWALCVYVEASDGQMRPWGVTTLAALALLVNPYFFVMVMAILVAAAGIAWSRGVSRSLLLRTTLQTGLVGLAILFASGYVTWRDSARMASPGFGTFAWNPATLVLPPVGLWPWGGVARHAAGGGPYEGESYLGLGVLALLVAALWVRRYDVPGLLRRHAVLVVVVLMCAAFAASNRLSFGPWHIVDLPMTGWMQRTAGILRASGRFVWPLVYVLALFPALLLMTRLPRRAWVAALVVAAVAQTLEMWPMRRLATTYSRSAEPDVLGQDQFAAWLDGHDRVWQYPSWFCGGFGRDEAVGHRAVRLETQIQFLAARRGLPINSAYMARRAKNCDREAAEARALQMRDGTLYVFSADAVASVPRIGEYAATPACRREPWGVVCSTSRLR